MFLPLVKLVGGGLFKLLGGDIAKNILGGVGDHFKGKRELAKAKQSTELEIELVRARSIAKQDDADIDMDLIRVKQAETSWKDEFWTIIFGSMFVSAFFFPVRLAAGLAVLGAMDSDMKYLMSMVITTAFGVSIYKKVRK